ncbi:hypothetical protein DV735_g4487, partial [Chaetothyriales sp. CBS 134920]
MRRSIGVFLLILLLVVGYALHSVSTLLALLIEDASADAIPRSDLPAPNSTMIEQRPQKIPKIIHQTYINESIPAHWLPAQQACIKLHPDYEYKLWTDDMSLEFIATEYPWFLATFKGYKYPIQRADAIRYFVLAHYGGIYIDLDDGCRRSLDPLLSYNAWVRRTLPTGISNDIMGAVPRHPFFLRVIESLQGANRQWFLPYITIMGSTGPLFLSVIWKRWMSEHAALEGSDWFGRVRVLMPDMYNENEWSFFKTYKGSSWHGEDAKLIFWMGRHWLLLTAAGFGIAGVVFALGWLIYRRLINWGTKRGRPRSRSGSPRGRTAGLRLPRWTQWSVQGRSKGAYELVQQHDA